MAGRILVVDDEPAILDSLTYALEREGYEVRGERDGRSALAAVQNQAFDVVVLDLMLPGLSGTEVCRQLRADSAVPILMLTAKDSEIDRVVGLELGADDYVTKPFSIAELVARLRALLRRRELDRAEPSESRRRVGAVEIDFPRHEVRVHGRIVELTPSEFRILSLLASAPGRVFSRRELVQELWRSEHTGGERACDAHVVSLRRKLERDPRRPERVVTVRGAGYRLDAV